MINDDVDIYADDLYMRMMMSIVMIAMMSIVIMSTVMMATVMMMVGGYAVSGDSWKWLMIGRKVVEGGKSHLHFQPILPRKWPWRVFMRDRWRHKMKLWNFPVALQLRANGHHYGGGSATLSDRCWKQKNTNSFLCFIFPPCGVNGHFEWRVSLGIHLFSSVLAHSSNKPGRKHLVATAGSSDMIVLSCCHQFAQ